MSCAEHGRLILLTREQMMAVYDKSEDALYDLWTAWDAAPADPAEAIAVALAFGSATPEWQERTWSEHANVVLVALGMPQWPTPRDEAPS